MVEAMLGFAAAVVGIVLFWEGFDASRRWQAYAMMTAGAVLAVGLAPVLLAAGFRA